MLNKKTVALILFFCLALPTYSWNNHAGITYLILKDHWKNNIPADVPAESLNSFLQKEKNAHNTLFLLG